MKPTDEIVVRPLRSFAKQAERLGFKLEWQDIPATFGPLRRFRVKLTGTTHKAREAVIRASGERSRTAIQTTTYYRATPRGDNRAALCEAAEVSAHEALRLAREVLE